METSRLGDLHPVLAGACHSGCRACLNACPFVNGVNDPRLMNEELYHRGQGPSLHFHENIGWHRACLVGHVRSQEVRSAAASGGLATWCLKTLLQERRVDKVAIVRFDPQPGKPLFRFVTVDDPEQIGAASGSIYHPVEISNVICEALSAPSERWAVIGVPCLCHAIRNVTRLRPRVPFLFGLACGMYQNTMYTEYLMAESGIRPDDVSRVVYREKSNGRTACDYAFRAYDRSGRPGRAVPYRGAPSFLGRCGHFRLNACNYCMDVFAETADATFMDAWLPEYSRDPRGASLVVARSAEALAILKTGAAEGSLELQELPSDHAARSQAGQIRRKQQLIGSRCGTALHLRTGATIRVSERVDWVLQRLAQRGSRLAWAWLGRKSGPLAYWAVLSPLAIAQYISHHWVGFRYSSAAATASPTSRFGTSANATHGDLTRPPAVDRS
jgi:coenzyme F420-reducing hydrogenase beta subunit